MNLSAGTLLRGGTYRIVRFIDSGGFGCTYEAEHLMLQKRVAIKEFFFFFYCNRDEGTSYVVVGIKSKEPLVDKLKKKFLDEARAVSRFRHPGIVQVSDVFEENGTAYYVMDYIEGRSLKDMVKAEGPMPERRALKYVFQVAEALKYVHARNRLHLDVKPGNIMVDGSDNAILIDFGTSKQYDEESGENTSTLLGYTPGYAPPEQMSKSVVKFLPATDVYALGATLYKLLTGNTPLDANDRISGDTLEPLPAGTADSVRRAVSAAMSLDKRQRPQSVEEFVGMLAACDKATVPDSDEATQPDDKAKGEVGESREFEGFKIDPKSDSPIENSGRLERKKKDFAVICRVWSGLLAIGAILLIIGTIGNLNDVVSNASECYCTVIALFANISTLIACIGMQRLKSGYWKYAAFSILLGTVPLRWGYPYPDLFMEGGVAVFLIHVLLIWLSHKKFKVLHK